MTTATLEQCNPVSWYTYTQPRSIVYWNIKDGWNKVSCITPRPCNWNGYNTTQFSDGVLLVIDGAYDMEYRQGLHLFPEILKPELYEFARVIEGFSNDGVCSGEGKDQAAGVMLSGSNNRIDMTLRIKTDTGLMICSIDRWE